MISAEPEATAAVQAWDRLLLPFFSKFEATFAIGFKLFGQRVWLSQVLAVPLCILPTSRLLGSLYLIIPFLARKLNVKKD